MEGNLPSGRAFPYSNWGAAAAFLGALLAVGVGMILGIVLAIPVAVLEGAGEGEVSDNANAMAQLGVAIGFLAVSVAIAAERGGATMREAARRLGLRRFRLSALKWMAASIGAYLLIAILYALLIVEPEQEDIAETFGAVPAQILLIAIAAPISEEICFRGMLFGGLRERLPRWAAALISATVFGALHAVSGLSAVPVLIAFGLILALLYEKTGSILPGILLHMLNNSVALLAQ